jgi:hypothetical protein
LSAIFEAGKILNIRCKKTLAEKLTAFAALRHTTNKTDAFYLYIESLETPKPENPKEVLTDKIFCPALDPPRLINKETCDTARLKMFEAICAKCPKDKLCVPLKLEVTA